MPYSGSGLSRCLKCDGLATVFDSRVDSNGWRWRRRRCTVCEHRWTTWEVPAELLDSLRAFIKTARIAKQQVDALNDLISALSIVDKDVLDQ